MKKHELISILIFILVVASSFYVNRESKVQGAQNLTCDQTLWSHVYKSDRLKILNDCMVVSGIIDAIKMENDGDYHIRLKLDSQYANLVNQKNIELLHGDLVLEPVCENPVLDPDAQEACRNFYGNIGVPPVGTHVYVSGSYVLDQTHGWTEIHPVTSIVNRP